jgi:hypothetical protein
MPVSLIESDSLESVRIFFVSFKALKIERFLKFEI